MARLSATGAVVQLVHDGKIYKPDAKGVFHVPDLAVEALLPHGFIEIRREADFKGSARPAQTGKGAGHGGR